MTGKYFTSGKVIGLVLVLLTATSGFAGDWADSWEGMHSFLVFAPQGDFTDQYISSIASRYDFGWSPRYRNALTAGNPRFVSAAYASSTQGAGEDYAWLQATHPDWILYGCDRVTPMLQFAYGGVSLDITNPEVIDYQFETANHDLIPANIGAPVAWDNFYLTNDFPLSDGTWGHACGIYDKNRKWVQKFAGNGSYAEVTDPQWTDAMIGYAAAIRDRLHALPNPRLLIPNADPKVVALDPVRSANLIAAIDGVLVEGGHFGPGWIGDERMLWLSNIRFVEAMNKAGKAYYSVDSPAGGATVPESYVQFTLASYLLAKGHSSALNIIPPLDAGTYESDGLFWPVEFQAATRIGVPCVPMSQVAGSAGTEDGLFMREHSGGVSLVNPSLTNSYTMTLSSESDYSDLYGNAVGSPVTLQPGAGLVLLKTSGAICSSATLPRVVDLTVRPEIVPPGASYVVEFSGANLDSAIYFDVLFRGPASDRDQEVLNWQLGTSGAHPTPADAAPGIWTITGVRGHRDEADHSGSLSAVDVSITVP